MISVDCKPLRYDYNLGNGTRHISHPDLQKVRRVLFGPVDHEETQRFIKTELEKEVTLVSRKWNFDFVNEKTLNPKGNYIWKAEVHPPKMRAVKRKHQDTYDNSDMYFDPASHCMKTKEPVKPAKPAAKAKSGAKQSNVVGPQRLMTDYLMVKKHSSVETTKKAKPVPVKKSRLTAS